MFAVMAGQFVGTGESPLALRPLTLIGLFPWKWRRINLSCQLYLNNEQILSQSLCYEQTSFVSLPTDLFERTDSLINYCVNEQT